MDVGGDSKVDPGGALLARVATKVNKLFSARLHKPNNPSQPIALARHAAAVRSLASCAVGWAALFCSEPPLSEPGRRLRLSGSADHLPSRLQAVAGRPSLASPGGVVVVGQHRACAHAPFG